MIGIDLVNLYKNNSRWKELRFQNKILSPVERHSDPLTKNTFWAYWAIKEAAYKCLSYYGYPRVFRPKDFICTPPPQNKNISGVVTINSEYFPCSHLHYYLTISYDSIMAIVYSTALSREDIQVHTSLIDDQANRSKETRIAAAAWISSHLNIPKKKIQITNMGRPTILIEGKPANWMLTLSHDENQFAAAICPTIDSYIY